MTEEHHQIDKATSKAYEPLKDRSQKYITLSILGLFIGLGLTMFLYSVTLISLFDLSKILVGSMVIGFFIPFKLYQKWFQFIKYEIIIFNLAGVGPVLTALFLSVNFLFSTPWHNIELQIDKIYFIDTMDPTYVGIILPDNLYEDEPKIVEFRNINPTIFKEKNRLKLTIDKGLFGYEIIKERELIY